jgi:hypothetical protein
VRRTFAPIPKLVGEDAEFAFDRGGQCIAIYADHGMKIGL